MFATIKTALASRLMAGSPETTPAAVANADTAISYWARVYSSTEQFTATVTVCFGYFSGTREDIYHDFETAEANEIDFSSAVVSSVYQDQIALDNLNVYFN